MKTPKWKVIALQTNEELRMKKKENLGGLQEKSILQMQLKKLPPVGSNAQSKKAQEENSPAKATRQLSALTGALFSLLLS